jgi:transcriptional regulator with XRE-family HTH domain
MPSRPIDPFQEEDAQCVVALQNLGRAIRRVRQAKRLTVEAAARRAGMSAGHLGVVERGRGNPRLKTLSSLADALGVTVEEVVRAAESEASRRGERRPAPEEFGQAERGLQRKSAPIVDAVEGDG